MADEKIMRDLVAFGDKESRYIWVIICLIEAVVIIIFNIITIMTFSINRKNFSRAVYMIINLSVSDMVYGCSMFITSLYKYNAPKSVEKQSEVSKINPVLETLLIFSIAVSGSSVTMVAVDRVIATVAPFRYRTIDHRHRVIVIGMDWCGCLGLALTHYFTPSKYANILWYLYVAAMLLVVIIIITSYTIIFIKVRRQGQLSNRSEQAAHQRERHMAYTLMIVTFCSLLTWVPIGVVFIVFQTTTITISIHLSICSIVIQASNSFINPVIYAFRMKEFRKALLQLLCKYIRIHPNNRLSN